MKELSADLMLVGDALQEAWRTEHQGRKQSSRPRRLILALTLIALAVGAGAAIGGSFLKTADDQEAGLVAGWQLFAGSDPVCERLSAVSFNCTLAQPPTGMTFYDEQGNQLLDAFLGIKAETVDSTRHIDGACAALSRDGRRWECLLGGEAVKRGWLAPNRLGTFLPETPTG